MEKQLAPFEVCHVEPIDDIAQHVTQGEVCWCSPIVEPQVNGSRLVIHHALDGRPENRPRLPS